MSHTQAEEYASPLPDSLGRIAIDTLERIPALASVISVPDYRYIYLNAAARYLCVCSGIEDPLSVIGAHPWESIPTWQDAFMDLYEAVRQSGEARLLDDFRCELGGEVNYWHLLLVPNSGADTDDITSITAIGVLSTVSKRAEMLGQALNTINAAINSTLDFDEIMRRAIAESSRAIGADTAIITLREDDFWVVKYTYGTHNNTLGNRIPTNTHSVSQLVADSRTVIAIDDAEADERLDPDATRQFGVRSILALPLIAREQVMGALVFRFMSRQASFSQVEVDFAGKLAASISMAIENARLYQDLQTAFVPSLLEVFDGYTAKALYIPARGGRIGGDFYDVFRTEAGRIAVLIGDVSGNGIEAAALASAARSTVRSFAHHRPSAAQALSYANSVLHSQQPPGSFATAFLVLIDPDTGMIRYSSAGHPPAAISRPGGRIDLLHCSNPPLGLVEKLQFEEAEDWLDRDCRIVFYTDGLSESRRPGGFFGIEGILETMRLHAGLPADQLIKELLAAASEESYGQLSDDTAIIVLDRNHYG